MVFIPVFLLYFVVPISVGYAGLATVLWFLGGRWDRNWPRAGARALAGTSGALVLVLLAGNALWFLLAGAADGSPLGSIFGVLTLALVVLSAAAVFVPPVAGIAGAALSDDPVLLGRKHPGG